jgi:hypothetical protein
MLFSKKPQEEVVLILDIQSAVVRGSLVKLRIENKPVDKPLILFTYNANIPYKAHTDSTFLIKMTLRAVEETVGATLRHLHIRNESSKVHFKIEAVHYALSSPWIVSEAKMLSMPLLRETKITRQFVLGLIEKERAKLIGSPTEPIRVIEEKIFDVALNGYSVSDWEGRSTKKLDVAFTSSVAGTRMIEHFVRECSHAVKANKVIFHSSLLLQHMAVEKMFPNKENYTIIHAHGEITDVAIIRKHSCAYFGSFPFGVRNLIRKIAVASHTEESAADSLLTLYTGGHLDETHGKESRATIERIALGWVSDLKKLFTETKLNVPPPLSIVFSAWGHDDFFVRILKDSYPKIPITLLSIDDMNTYLSYDPLAERRRLPALYSIALNGLPK